MTETALALMMTLTFLGLTGAAVVVAFVLDYFQERADNARMDRMLAHMPRKQYRY